MQITLSLRVAKGHVVSFKVDGPAPPHAYQSFFDTDADYSEIPPTQLSLDYLLKWAEWNDHHVDVDTAITNYLSHDRAVDIYVARYPNYDKLHPHQREFLKFVMDNALNNSGQARVINADDARLGKSIETLAAVRELELRYDKTGPVLILCPKSTMAQWERYCEEWFGNFAFVITGETEQRELLIDMALKASPDAVVITNYHTARAINVLQWDWNTLIVDEAHALKNKDSQISKRVLPIAKKAKHVFLLSATFVERSPEDWWSPLHIVDPGLHSSYWRWYGWFVESREGFFARETIGPKNTKIMRNFVGHTIIQRRSDDVANMPEKIIEPYYVELEQDHMDIYNDRLDLIRREGGALEGMMALRQIAINPNLVQPFTYGRWGAKVEALAQLASDVIPPDEQFIVFSSFVGGCELAKKNLSNAVVWAGDADPEALEQFLNGNVRALCATPQKGGIGLNLFNANWAIFLDMPWSTVQIQQAEERVRAIGKLGPVYIYRLIAKDTVDEYVHDKILAKMENVTESQIIDILTKL